jgi:hypothetical protein
MTLLFQQMPADFFAGLFFAEDPTRKNNSCRITREQPVVGVIQCVNAILPAPSAIIPAIILFANLLPMAAYHFCNG